MRIDPKHIRQVAQPGLERAESKEVVGPQAAGVDSASEAPAVEESVLSARAEEIRVAREALEQLPPVREQRVADLKRRLETGAYQVSSEDIARKMLRPE